jgi:O-antigen/teichoic acid export membrane protein
MIGSFITYQVLLMVMVALAVALLSPEMIQIIAAPSFWLAYQVVPWIALGYLARFLVFFPMNGLLYSKRPKWIAVATIVAAALNITLNLLLVPYFGIMAAAVNTFVAFAVLLVLMMIVGQREFPLRYETARLLRLGLAALLLFALGWWITPTMLWLSLAYKTAVVAALPVLLWVTGFFTPSERKRVGQVLRLVAKKLP